MSCPRNDPESLGVLSTNCPGGGPPPGPHGGRSREGRPDVNLNIELLLALLRFELLLNPKKESPCYEGIESASAGAPRVCGCSCERGGRTLVEELCSARHSFVAGHRTRTERPTRRGRLQRPVGRRCRPGVVALGGTSWEAVSGQTRLNEPGALQRPFGHLPLGQSALRCETLGFSPSPPVLWARCPGRLRPGDGRRPAASLAVASSPFERGAFKRSRAFKRPSGCAPAAPAGLHPSLGRRCIISLPGAKPGT